MKNILISSLLGVAVLVVQDAASQDILKVSVAVLPSGSHIYLSECVLLLCVVDTNSSFEWNYQWFRHKPHTPQNPNPRHLVSGNSYSITAVARADAGSYWCQAERKDSNVTMELLSSPATLTVLDPPPRSLTLTSNTLQVFEREPITLKCPMSQSSSSSWMLRHFFWNHKTGTKRSQNPSYLPPEGTGGPACSDPCVFTASINSSGLYWCEGGEARSNAIRITVSSGPAILKSPANPVSEGDNVILSCKYRKAYRKTAFFKNGIKIIANNSSTSDRVVKITIENVTHADEGFYKCASQDRRMQSPESWLSINYNSASASGTTTYAKVTAFPSITFSQAAILASLSTLQGNLETKQSEHRSGYDDVLRFFAIKGESTSNIGVVEKTMIYKGSRKWIVALGGILLVSLFSFAVCLVLHYRYKMNCIRSCRTVSNEEPSAGELPATKQDVTEVEWDMSWVEMSNLLDKQPFPCT